MIKNKQILKDNSNVFTMLLVLIGLVALISILTPKFFVVSNLTSVLQNSTIFCLLAAGETFVILTGGIDLSIGSIYALCGMVVANTSVIPEYGVLGAALIGILLGVGCGAFNGMLVNIIKLPPFIATLGTMTIIRGFSYIAIKKGEIYSLPDGLRFLGNKDIGPIPLSVIFTLFIIAIIWFVLKRTRFGSSVYAVGSNPTAAMLSGIRPKVVKFSAYIICGLLCTISAWVGVGRLNQINVHMGIGYELDAITAAAIGGISLKGGSGNIWGILIGAVIVQVIINGMILLTISEFIQTIITGLVILIAVGADSIRQKHANRQ